MDIIMKTLCIIRIPNQQNIHDLKNWQSCTSAVPQVHVHNLLNAHKVPNQHTMYFTCSGWHAQPVRSRLCQLFDLGKTVAALPDQSSLDQAAQYSRDGRVGLPAAALHTSLLLRAAGSGQVAFALGRHAPCRSQPGSSRASSSPLVLNCLPLLSLSIKLVCVNCGSGTRPLHNQSNPS
jgi:hypothetical protein